jgi:hypothetical protein
VRPKLFIAPPIYQPLLSSAAFVEWRLPDDTLWCEIHRGYQHYLMRFPELADFIVRMSGVVECHPVIGTSKTTLQHLFYNQVLPAALSMQHCAVFHASCVAINNVAVAFVGLSGRGKSTLATFLGLHGCSLLSDDGLELAWQQDHYRAQPSNNGVRLWQDSSNALLPQDAQPAPPISYSSKQRFLDESIITSAGYDLPLHRAYFLGDGTAKKITISPMPAYQAHMAWVKHSFMLDAHDRSRMISHFQQVSRLVRQGVAYHLDYPRSYGSLSDVMTAIKAHL